MSVTTVYCWQDGRLSPNDAVSNDDVAILAADSMLVTNGSTLALGLHRSRFLQAVNDQGAPDIAAESFWDAAVAILPRNGDWFPRFELRRGERAPELVLRVRPAPERNRSIVVTTHEGADPRPQPLIKGPGLGALAGLKHWANERGADEVVILGPEGHIVEGATTSLMWWQGSMLSVPALEFDRVDSVTARSVLALATAMGVDISWEESTPADLNGLEVWALNALHGIRIVTRWHDGPSLAELPGRLGEWRARLAALSRPIPAPQGSIQ